MGTGVFYLDIEGRAGPGKSGSTRLLLDEQNGTDSTICLLTSKYFFLTTPRLSGQDLALEYDNARFDFFRGHFSSESRGGFRRTVT